MEEKMREKENKREMKERIKCRERGKKMSWKREKIERRCEKERKN